MKKAINQRGFALAIALMLLCAMLLSAPAQAISPKLDYGKTMSVTDANNYAISDLINADGSAKGALDSAVAPVVFSNSDLKSAASYTELLSYIHSLGAITQQQTSAGSNYDVEPLDELEVTEDAVSEPEAVAMTDSDAGSSTAYSTTNTQVKNVDEADIIKTDGKYIYYLNPYAARVYTTDAKGNKIYDTKSTVSIVSAAGSKMQTVATIYSLYANEHFSDMYISGDKLIILSSYSRQTPLSTDINGVTTPACYREYANFYVYDIKDRSAPKVLRTVRIEGIPVSTRFVNNTLYFATNNYFWNYNYKTEKLAAVLPTYEDSILGKRTNVLPPSSIYYVPGSKISSYMQVGSFNINASEAVDVQAIFGSGNTLYMNTQSMYIARDSWTTSDTVVYRFGISNHKLRYSATANVPGRIINQYAMDEYNKSFRIATTSDNNTSNVYIYDQQLQKQGAVEGLAPGEQIQSVRFSGNTGYLVTFENMDPLFVIDLTNPVAPKVMGELKIPGFSQYLHPVGNGLLIGLGRETTETYIRNAAGLEEVTGFTDRGFKVSLFDVSNPYNPKEIDKLVLGDSSTYSSAPYNPKTIMVDNKKNVFAFPVIAYNPNNTDSNNIALDPGLTGLVILITKDKKLALNAKLAISTNSGDYGNEYLTRFVYIGNTLYFASRSSIKAFDYTTYKLLTTHKLK